MENQKKNIKDYLDENGFFKEQTTLVVALFDQDGIYQGKAEEIFSAGTCPPTLPVIDFPPDMKPAKNQVIRWSGKNYYLDWDYRGQTVYKKETGEPVKVEIIGALPDDLTEKEYPGEFYDWGGADWVLNQEKKDAATIAANEAQKSTLLAHAKEQIDILTDELDLDLAEDINVTKARLKAWKVYRVKLNKVDTANPVWPEKPEN